MKQRAAGICFAALLAATSPAAHEYNHLGTLSGL
jgi:hypothetical protein